MSVFGRRSWTEHADVMALEYETLLQDPGGTMDELLSFIGVEKKNNEEASNATKLNHDWSNVLNLEEYAAVPRWKVRDAQGTALSVLRED